MDRESSIMEPKEKSSFFPRFSKPKELVMSIIVLGMGATFCYLTWMEIIPATSFEKLFTFVLGTYVGGKFALSGNGK